MPDDQFTALRSRPSMTTSAGRGASGRMTETADVACLSAVARVLRAHVGSVVVTSAWSSARRALCRRTASCSSDCIASRVPLSSSSALPGRADPDSVTTSVDHGSSAADNLEELTTSPVCLVSTTCPPPDCTVAPRRRTGWRHSQVSKHRLRSVGPATRIEWVIACHRPVGHFTWQHRIGAPRRGFRYRCPRAEDSAPQVWTGRDRIEEVNPKFNCKQ